MFDINSSSFNVLICILIALSPFYLSSFALMIKNIIDCWANHTLSKEAFYDDCLVFSVVIGLISFIGFVVYWIIRFLMWLI